MGEGCERRSKTESGFLEVRPASERGSSCHQASRPLKNTEPYRQCPETVRDGGCARSAAVVGRAAGGTDTCQVRDPRAEALKRYPTSPSVHRPPHAPAASAPPCPGRCARCLSASAPSSLSKRRKCAHRQCTFAADMTCETDITRTDAMRVLRNEHCAYGRNACVV